MDGTRFDEFTRALATASSRRGIVRAALASLAGLAVAVAEDDFSAAQSACQICTRDGKCRNRRDGARCGACLACFEGACTQPVADRTSCGECGLCSGGACSPDVSSGACGVCGLCEPSTMQCVPAPRLEGESCGTCGTCRGGQCLANLPSGCEECERCRRQADGSRSCESRCDRGKRCCPGGDCVDADECCPGEDRRCPVDNECCSEDCCGGECCATDQQCCNNGCCSSTKVCFNNEFCCVEGAICQVPGTSDFKCCEGQVCCPSSGQCAPSTEACCQACDPCQSCDPESGECVDTTDREGQRCEVDGVTGPCGGICKSSRCTPIQNNQLCADNTICCDSGCCSSRQQACCGGQCCDGECCGGECCEGFCIGDTVCCPTGLSLGKVAGSEFCCPFGPPCGEGADARCCEENQTCCAGQCRPSDTVVPCVDGCCDKVAGDLCTADGCCSIGRQETPCGTGVDPANDSICCRSDETCCLDFCCPGEPFTMGTCCFDGCCPEGWDCNGDCFHSTGRGCCPPDSAGTGCASCEVPATGRR